MSAAAPEVPIPSWTKRDEEDLNFLLSKKKDFESHFMPPVKEVARALSEIPEDRRWEWMIDRADYIRDVLEPFDSGVRGSKS